MQNNIHKAVNEAEVYDSIIRELKSRTSYKMGFNFGESTQSVNKDIKLSLAENLSNIVFGSELNNVENKMTVSSSEGINAGIAKNALLEMKKEFDGRSKNLFTSGESYAFGNPVGSQAFGVYGSFLPVNNQLLLLALAPSVIKPIYNKVFKSMVVKGLSFDRVVDIPFIKTEKGETLSLYDALNSKDALLNISAGGQPTIQITVPITNKQNDPAFANLITVYNREGVLNDPHFVEINSITDFIARGVEIVGVEFENGTKQEGRIWKASGQAAQSGQAGREVATISCPLVKKTDGKKVNLAGALQADGDLVLYTNDDSLKNVTFKFYVPAKGAVEPVNVVMRKTTASYFITKHWTAATTTNPQLIADSELVLGKDLIKDFSEQSVSLMNSRIDGEALAHLEKLVELGASNAALGDNKYLNEATAEDGNGVFSYANVDMENEDYSYATRMEGHSMIMAQRIYEIMNKIDRVKNPQEKKFSIVSNTLATRWVTENGKNTNGFNYIGESLDSVAGIKIPYTSKAVEIGGSYYGSYIATNKLEPAMVNKDIVNKAGKKVGALAHQHRLYITGRFEENLDGTVVAHGVERIYEGTNDNEYRHDFKLNYEKRYDILTFDTTIGVLDFTELGGYSTNAVK